MRSDATDGGLALSYDQENRISGTGGYTYTYDADGNRVKKTNGTTGTIYWYMTLGIVAESDLSGALKSEYVFFDGERVARRDLPAGSVAYYFSDHLKTASVITDSLGNIKSESDYYPWGGELQFVANDSNHYKFTGKERDSESGLDYFGARYYSNGLARFITPDWAAKATAVPYAEFADPQSLNLYTYVRNIPTSRVDADGHQCDWCKKAMESIKQGAKELAIGADKGVRDLATRIGGPAYGEATGTKDIAGHDTGITQPNNTLQQISKEGTEAAIGVAFAGPALAEGEAGGRLGSPATRAQNSAIADSLESRGFTITGGGGRLPEEYIPGPGGGTKGSNYVDVTATREGSTVRVQTVDTRADGVTPTTREAKNAARIRSQQQPGDHTVLIPKKKAN